MIEYEDLFNRKFCIMKTIPLEGFRTIKEKNRQCKTCSEYNTPEKDVCIPVGIIANPDCSYCSWWKDKKVKLNNVRSYQSIK